MAMSRSFGGSVVTSRPPMRSVPLGDRFKPGDHIQRCRLATAGGAHQHGELAVRYIQI